MANVSFTGGKELFELLQTLPAKLEKNIMRGALRAGAKVILDEAKQNVPVSSGDLRDSLRVSTSGKGGKVMASVKAGNKKVWYSRLVEFGVAAHNINASGNGFLSFGGFFTKSVQHPGFQAKAFLRPAFDSKNSEAIEEIGRHIGKRLTKQGLNQSVSLEVESE
jgi:HK97 gp10 family phage protein